MSEIQPNARLVYREDLTESLRIFRVQPEAGPPPDFEPGQFVQLALPEQVAARTCWVRRSYSIASPPGLPYLEIYFQVVAGGAFSELMRSLEPGARLWLGPKAHGNFTLRGVEPTSDIVAVATGTGIAPYLSMLGRHPDRPPWNRFALLHGARLAADLGYRGRLEERAARDPAFSYLPMVTREPEESAWQGLRGRVQTLFEPQVFERLFGFELDPQRCHVFLCGNPRMIDELRDRLVQQGFRPYSRAQGGNLHFERYW